MALKALVESLEDLPETIELKREEAYVEKNGKFVLNVTPFSGYELDDVSGLKSALAKSRSLASENYEKLKTYDGLGDPGEVRDKLKKFEDIKDLDPEKKIAEATKARLEDISRKHNAEKDELGKTISELTGQLENELITAQATKALVDKGVDAVELALPHVTKNSRMRKNEAGKYVVEILDSEGNIRVGDVHGNPMNFTGLLEEMETQKQFGAIFPGTGSSGSGTTTTKKVTKVDSGTSTSSVKMVPLSDQDTLNNSLEALASGEVKPVFEE